MTISAESGAECMADRALEDSVKALAGPSSSHVGAMRDKDAESQKGAAADRRKQYRPNGFFSNKVNGLASRSEVKGGLVWCLGKFSAKVFFL